MSTLSTAIAALLNVGKTTFQAQSGDPTWGALYAAILWKDAWPFAEVKSFNPTIFLYELGGQPAAQGLGTVKQWRHPRIRVDIFCNANADVRQAFEALRSAWITDFNYVNGSGAVGQGYLRQTGSIKNIEIGDDRA